MAGTWASAAGETELRRADDEHHRRVAAEQDRQRRGREAAFRLRERIKAARAEVQNARFDYERACRRWALTDGPESAVVAAEQRLDTARVTLARLEAAAA